MTMPATHTKCERAEFAIVVDNVLHTIYPSDEDLTYPYTVADRWTGFELLEQCYIVEQLQLIANSPRKWGPLSIN